MFCDSTKTWVDRGVIATFNVKWERFAVPCLSIAVTPRYFLFHSPGIARFMCRPLTIVPTVSAVASWMICHVPSWRISSITLSPRQTFVQIFGEWRFASLEFRFSALSQRVHGFVPFFDVALGRGRVVDERRCSVPFPLPIRIIRFIDEEDFMIPLDDSSFDLLYNLDALRSTQYVDWSKSFGVGWFIYLLVHASVHKWKVFTVLDGELGNAGELILSENPPEVIATWLLEDYFWYRVAESAVVHNDDEVPLLQAIYSAGPATSPVYYVDLDAEGDWEFADLTTAYEPLKHTVLKKTFTEL